MISDQIKAVHGNAKSKGFYELPEGILEKMKTSDFSDEEVRAVKDAFIAQRLMLTVSELGEALEANRINKFADLDKVKSDGFKGAIKDSFEDELADSVIRIMDLSGWLGIDLSKHIELKHEYNTQRPYLHGKKY